jgi:hypothetical protein
MFKHGARVAAHYAPEKVKPYLGKWRVYGDTGFKYTLHVGTPHLISRMSQPLDPTETAEVLSELESARFGANTGEVMNSEYGTDLDEVDERLDEEQWDVVDTSTRPKQ